MKVFYDIIGDIHGCAVELETLLRKMSYVEKDGVYSHPEGRQVIFLGDFIDRGPDIRRVLQIAKSMCDSGSALSVLGNHEYNAVAYHTKNPKTGFYLRERISKNISQHLETLDAFEDREEEWQEYIDWFRTLPLYLQIGNLNIVHACWDQRHIDTVDQYALKKDSFLCESAIKGTTAYQSVETLLKGMETHLGEGVSLRDQGGHARTEMRVKWWLSEEDLTECRNLYEVSLSIPESARSILENTRFIFDDHASSFCGLPAGLTFVGHYWFLDESPIIRPSLSCLDFSCVKGGRLAAYRWCGEEILQEENFVMVSAD